MKNRNIVLKIGGSIIYREDYQVDRGFMQKILLWFQKNMANYDKIVIVTGGGKLSRGLVNQIGEQIFTEEAKHRVAMEVTQVSAAIIGGILGMPEVLRVPISLEEAYKFLGDESCKVLVTGGLKLGWSTDMDAAVLADFLDVKTVYKLSNIDFVYDKDPKQYTDAKMIKHMRWLQFIKKFGCEGVSSQRANQHVPIDCITANFCRQKGISFYVSGGKTLINSVNLNQVFQSGSLIYP